MQRFWAEKAAWLPAGQRVGWAAEQVRVAAAGGEGRAEWDSERFGSAWTRPSPWSATLSVAEGRQLLLDKCLRPGSARRGAAPRGKHGLAFDTMALITSDCGAPRSLKHQMALIASGCCVPSSAELIGRLRLAGHDAWQRAGVDSSDRNGSRPEGPGQPEGGRGALTLEGGVYNAAYADPSQPEGFESAAGRKDLYAL